MRNSKDNNPTLGFFGVALLATLIHHFKDWDWILFVGEWWYIIIGATIICHTTHYIFNLDSCFQVLTDTATKTDAVHKVHISYEDNVSFFSMFGCSFNALIGMYLWQHGAPLAMVMIGGIIFIRVILIGFQRSWLFKRKEQSENTTE